MKEVLVLPQQASGKIRNMGANNDPVSFCLYVGETQTHQIKLYSVIDNPADSRDGWWEAEKKLLRDLQWQTFSRSDNEDEVRKAAERRARELYESAEDLANKMKLHSPESWYSNLPRPGPTLWFKIDPWPQS